MGVVWSDYDTFDSLSVCMKALSIYIIMARLDRITGLEWAKMYEKLHSVLIWSPQKGGVLSMSQTTQIKLEPKDCIFLVK